MRMPLDFFTYFSQQCKHGVVMPVQSDGEACQRTSKQHKAAFADPGRHIRPQRPNPGQPQRPDQACGHTRASAGQASFCPGILSVFPCASHGKSCLRRVQDIASVIKCSQKVNFGFASLRCENSNVKVLQASARTFFRLSVPQ